MSEKAESVSFSMRLLERGIGGSWCAVERRKAGIDVSSIMGEDSNGVDMVNKEWLE